MIKAKKSLGQNFLTDRKILKKISNLVPIKGKYILEVGPGTGNLTSFILKNFPKKLLVIEKDNELAINLDKIFKDQIKIINADVLNVNETLLFEKKIKATVYGNLPYNVSTEILSKWIINLKDEFWFEHLILMFQKLRLFMAHIEKEIYLIHMRVLTKQKNYYTTNHSFHFRKG